MEMNHSWLTKDNSLNVKYNWKKGDWNSFEVNASPLQSEIRSGSKEEFITEHFWGYTFINNSKTSEYGVEHPRWKVYDVKDYSINVDFVNVYGNDFQHLLREKPQSVFLAEGSEILVKEGSYLV
jgi:hypothetical protein